MVVVVVISGSGEVDDAWRKNKITLNFKKRNLVVWCVSVIYL